MERSNFPHRNLGEDDEELLNGIWAGLEMPDDRPDADGRDFDDVKRRIRRRVRRRWMSRAALAGSAAAIVAAVVLVVRQPGVLPEPDAFAQLQQMGVTVERPQVVMTADDGMRLVLENAARLERRSEGEVALRTETGEQRPLASERKLKVEVPNGRQFRLVLDDGSEVWLNAGSKLEYPATFENASERRVERGLAVVRERKPACSGRASGAHIRHPGGGGRPARGVYLLRENPPGQGR